MDNDQRTRYFIVLETGQILDFDSKALLNRHLSQFDSLAGMTIIRGRVVQAMPRLAV